MKLQVTREFLIDTNIGLRDLCKFLGLKYKKHNGEEMSIKDCEDRMNEKGIYYTIYTDYNDYWGDDVNTLLILDQE